MDGKNLDSERKRRLFSEDDLQILISTYEANPAPDSKEWKKLATNLNRSTEVIHKWFYRRRQKEKNEAKKIKELKSGHFSDRDRRMLVSAYENDPMPGREIYLELSQKLNRKSESIIQWFKKRRAQEREQKEKQVIDEQETQDDEDREKLNSGPFSDDHRRILFASFDANQHPGSEGYRELAERLNRKKDSIIGWFRIKRKQKRQADQEAVPMEVENLPGITIEEIEEREESDEDEYEILTTTITKSICVGGPIINKEGVKVGYVTAEEVRKTF